MACRAFAAAFADLVTARGVAATCVREAERDSDVNALDAEINAVNDSIADNLSQLMCKRFQEVSQR